MTMHLRIVVMGLALAATCSCHAENPHPDKSIGIEEYPNATDLYEFAERQRRKHGLPALGVGVIRDGRIIALGMAGERKIGSGDRATLADRFDVASCSKPVTATVAAILVEQGVARWDMTIGEVFPEMRGKILPVYSTVTLEMLLRHRSGLDRWMRTNKLWIAWNRDHAGTSATEKRKLFAAEVLTHEPHYVPGTETYYCNDGYLVAGSMLERVSGKAWEDIVAEELFDPLGLDSMRFGVSMRVWGHDEGGWFGKTRPIEPRADEYGNPPFGSPGGFLHCTVADLLRFVDFHIQGANGSGKLLSGEAFTKLHTPVDNQHYALGWAVETKRDAEGRVIERSIYHGGSSGRFRANMWFCPETRIGTVIVYNHGGDDEADAYVDIFYALLEETGVTKMNSND